MDSALTKLINATQWIIDYPTPIKAKTSQVSDIDGIALREFYTRINNALVSSSGKRKQGYIILRLP